jgi:hypothetical protein
MLISRQSLLFRWVYLPKLLTKGSNALPTKVNLCPFFWRMVFSPITNIVLLPVFALMCVAATIILWTIAILLGQYIVYKESHWDKDARVSVKNHKLWDCLTRYFEDNRAVEDSFIWSTRPNNLFPKAFGLRLNPALMFCVGIVLYAQFWGLAYVSAGVFPWRLSFIDDHKGFIIAAIWMATSAVTLLVISVYGIASLFDSKVAETTREFIAAKKNRWCPEIEIV